MVEPVRTLSRIPASPGSGGGPREGAAPAKSALREYSEAGLIALVLALVIRTFFIQAYKIPSGSMVPTLLIGDHILVNKLSYGLRMPDSFFGLHLFTGVVPYGKYLFKLESIHRGDVAVFVFPADRSKDFIKRVIAIGGDTVQIKDGLVYLNGMKNPDPHAHYEIPALSRSMVSLRDNAGPFKVPEGKLFMMGDNRDRSYDSRFWGFVDRNDIEGRALVIYWSWNSDGNSLLPVRWSRFGRLVE